MTGEPTREELVNAYWRSKLPTIGLSFRQAMQAASIAWALRRSALSHRTAPAPTQAALALEETLA